jgi:hypothetical protein
MRAKFNVTSFTKYGNEGGVKITMSPVMGNSHVNKSFWEATPYGLIDMHITNPTAIEELSKMGEFYIDFTRVED